VLVSEEVKCDHDHPKRWSEEECLLTTKVDYGDKTFCHNMSLFRHRIHMVMKQHSSP